MSIADSLREKYYDRGEFDECLKEVEVKLQLSSISEGERMILLFLSLSKNWVTG
jgi:hypothetical protein